MKQTFLYESIVIINGKYYWKVKEKRGGPLRFFKLAKQSGAQR